MNLRIRGASAVGAFVVVTGCNAITGLGDHYTEPSCGTAGCVDGAVDAKSSDATTPHHDGQTPDAGRDAAPDAERAHDALPPPGDSAVESGGCEAGALQCQDGGFGVESCVGGAWAPPVACLAKTCVAGECTGDCAPGATQCGDGGVQTCTRAGSFGGVTACSDSVCVPADGGHSGSCKGSCAAGQTNCSGNGLQQCVAGQWGTPASCFDRACVVSSPGSASCTGVCSPGTSQCSGQQPQVCTSNGTWTSDGSPCSDTTCLGGTCTGVCAPGEMQCQGTQPQTCGNGGQWENSGAITEGMCGAVCSGDSVQCSGQQRQQCNAGVWQDSGSPCSDSACVNGSCEGNCVPGATQCCYGSSCSTSAQSTNGDISSEVCDAQGNWEPSPCQVQCESDSQLVYQCLPCGASATSTCSVPTGSDSYCACP